MSNVIQFAKVQQHEDPSVPSDLRERIAALDTRTSCIVEAPAGSGKTGLLMQRYLKLLADVAVTQPEEVLAITFTNKATAELRERVIKQLQAAQDDVPLNETASLFEHQTRELAVAALEHDRQLGWGLLSRPQRLNIRTIDSVSVSIASSLPILTGSGGSLRPANDAKPLHRLAAKRTLMQLGGNDRALHESLRTVLLRRDASLSEVTSLIADMLAEREQWGQLIPLDPEHLTDEYLETNTRPQLENTLETIVCHALTRLAHTLPEGTLQILSELAADLGRNDGYEDIPNPLALCSLIDGPPDIVATNLEHWKALVRLLLTDGGDWRKPRGLTSRNLKFNFDKLQKARIEVLLEAVQSDELADALLEVRKLPPARYPDDQWNVLRALFHVLRRALIELQLVFAECGTCDFAEFSIAARQALSMTYDGDASIDLALAPGGKLRHLLVDEMQDTSAAQYQLIQRLTQSWDGATQTLFLVGDPKQSIYLFRQARVERFLRTMQDGQLGDITLRVLHLTANFRSQAGLVNACNESFELLFPSLEEVQATGDLSRVPYTKATSIRAATDTLNIKWHPSLSKDKSSAEANSLRAENEKQQAREVCSIIESWRSKPLPANRKLDEHGNPRPWSIAVLARARTHFGALVSELKRADISYKAVEIDPLTKRQEVFDVLALTRALLHPSDRVAWLAVLRAPWCGLSLADLLVLTGEGDTADKTAPLAELVDARLQSLSTESRELLNRVWPILTAALNSIGTEPLATHVERTWRTLGGDLFLDIEERKNVLCFFDVLRDVTAENSFVDLSVLNDRLKTLYAEPDPATNSVELLTIHKAKGLEWDVVIVPSLERQTGNSRNDLLNWLELDETGEPAAAVLVAPIEGKGSIESDLLAAWLKNARRTRELAEQSRLFYVLSTRAREELHLFAAARSTDSTVVAPSDTSLLHAVWPVAVHAFAELQQHSTPSQDFESPLELQEPFALDLAAAATEKPAVIRRLPAGFDPATRFIAAAKKKLPYTPASSLQLGPIFDRPEGSFAVRAFGNVVHRYLQIVAQLLERKTISDLVTELAGWQPRLLASLRGEGLPPALAEREAARALRAIEQSVNDKYGRWILSPQPNAFNERPLTLAAANTLRVDRTFSAGPAPLSVGQTHTWIVDFKTGTARGLSETDFEVEERGKYGPQLAVYAEAAKSLSPQKEAVILGLYYPQIPRLLFWEGSCRLMGHDSAVRATKAVENAAGSS